MEDAFLHRDPESVADEIGKDRDALALDVGADAGRVAEMVQIGRQAIRDVDARRHRAVSDHRWSRAQKHPCARHFSISTK